MKLKHFGATDCATEKTLQKKYRALSMELHPDKVPEATRESQRAIFQEMLAEYEFLKINRGQYKTSSKRKFTKESWKVSPDADADYTAKLQAQALFHAITNLNSVDTNLLVNTLKSVKDWKRLAHQFAKAYGMELIPSILNKIKDEKKRAEVSNILTQLEAGKLVVETVISFANSLKNLFKK